MRVLITGSGRAIGAATAIELSRRGHHVVATARDVSLLDDLDVAQRLALDVTDDGSVDAALAQAGELDAIDDPTTALRVPVGADAEMILATRRQLDDASFESAMRQALDLTW